MLFKDDTSLQEYASLSQDTFIDVKSTIAMVENKHLIPILGLMQYEELNANFNAPPGDGIPTRLLSLLDYCRKVIGPWVCVYFTPKTDVKVSGAGARRMESDKAKTAFQYQVKNFVDANRQEAMDAQEFLLAFLEEKKADYPLWVAGPGNAAYRKLFIKTASEFNELFFTPAPHSNFWAIKSKMVDVEEIILPPAIGADIYSSLKTKTRNSTALNEVEEELLYAVKKAVAALSVAEALPFVHLRMAEDGMTSGGGNFASNDAYSSRIPATDNALNLFKSSAADLGRTWLAKAKQIIKNNPDTFTAAAGPETPASKTFKSVFGLR